MTKAIERTDVHRPSEIKTEDYVWVGEDYLGSSGDPFFDMWLAEERRRFHKQMAKMGWTWARHEHGGTCGCCGASAMYVGLYLHKPTNQVLKIGHQCAVKMDEGEDRRFRTFRTKVKDVRDRAAGWAKAELLLREDYGFGDDAPKMIEWSRTQENHNRRAECLLIEMAGVELPGPPKLETPAIPSNDQEQVAYNAYWDAREKWEQDRGEAFRKVRKILGNLVIGKVQKAIDRRDICRDLIDKLAKWGGLSEKQVDFLSRLWKEDRVWDLEHVLEEAKAKVEEQKAQDAARADAPEGRVQVIGKVLSIREPDEMAAFPAWKMLIEVEDGNWKGWMTIPSILVGDVERGSRVQVTATWKPSDDDKKFAFGSRPAKASLLDN